MRSYCITVSPHSTWSYAWKLPATSQMRPVLTSQAHHSNSRPSAWLQGEAAGAEHSSISWKTYLASRELKNLASDLADAVFSPSSTSLSSPETERPSSLNTREFAQTAGQPSAGSLVTSVLADAGDAPRDNAGKQALGLALAA